MQKNFDWGQSKALVSSTLRFPHVRPLNSGFWVSSSLVGVRRNKSRIFCLFCFCISGGRDWNWDHRIHHHHLFEKGSDWKQDSDHFRTSSWIRIQNKAKWGKSAKTLQKDSQCPYKSSSVYTKIGSWLGSIWEPQFILMLSKMFRMHSLLSHLSTLNTNAPTVQKGGRKKKLRIANSEAFFFCCWKSDAYCNLQTFKEEQILSLQILL